MKTQQTSLSVTKKLATAFRMLSQQKHRF